MFLLWCTHWRVISKKNITVIRKLSALFGGYKILFHRTELHNFGVGGEGAWRGGCSIIVKFPDFSLFIEIYRLNYTNQPYIFNKIKL